MPRKKVDELTQLSEKIVNRVIAKYLNDVVNINVKPTRGAGPDFIYNGNIVETKGSDSNFDRAINQMLDYAPKYKSLKFGLPIGFFTAQRIMQLNTLAKIIGKRYNKNLTILTVFQEKPPDNYRVGEIHVDSLAYNVMQRIGEINEWTYPEHPAKSKNYDANMIKKIDILVRAAIIRLMKYDVKSANIQMPSMDSMNHRS